MVGGDPLELRIQPGPALFLPEPCAGVADLLPSCGKVAGGAPPGEQGGVQGRVALSHQRSEGRAVGHATELDVDLSERQCERVIQRVIGPVLQIDPLCRPRDDVLETPDASGARAQMECSTRATASRSAS